MLIKDYGTQEDHMEDSVNKAYKMLTANINYLYNANEHECHLDAEDTMYLEKTLKAMKYLHEAVAINETRQQHHG